jgi:Ca2+-binding RTX toxin-like protein
MFETMIRKLNRTRPSRRHTAQRSLALEMMERRVVLSGFVVDPAGAPAGLYYEVSASEYNDTVNVGKSPSGDIAFLVTYTDSDGNLNEETGTVSAGEIALAQLMTGASFKGVYVDGLEGNDTLVANAAFATPDPNTAANVSVVFLGGIGNDTLTGSSKADTLIGGVGSDTMKGMGGNDTLLGLGGNDSLEGGAGKDSLSGGDGNDTLVGDGADTNPSGGADIDTFTGTTAFNIVNNDIEVINGSTGNDTVNSTNYTFVRVELPVATPDPAKIVFNGGDGNDTLISSLSKPDEFNGGTGTDTVSYATSNAAVIVNLASNQNFGGSAEGDKLSLVENVIGSGFDDDLTGNNVANVISGGDGADFIDGGRGNDTLNGNAGNDEIYGNIGDDTIDGGTGDDQAYGGSGADTLIIDWNLLNFNDILFGDALADTFRVVNVPVAVTTTTFTNTMTDYLETLAFNSQGDWAPATDLIVRA